MFFYKGLLTYVRVHTQPCICFMTAGLTSLTAEQLTAADLHVGNRSLWLSGCHERWLHLINLSFDLMFIFVRRENREDNFRDHMQSKWINSLCDYADVYLSFFVYLWFILSGSMVVLSI